MKLSRLFYIAAALALICHAPKSVAAMDVAATTTALRLANTITGGYMPSSDPIFAQMVAKVQAGDLAGAATLAADSKNFASYHARRLALQMQTPALDASTGTDNDATAFLIAHFVGANGVPPSLSTIWSENATYLVNRGGTPVHAADLSAADLASVDWATDLVRTEGQTAVDLDGNPVTIPAKHVGGYATLSDRANDNSFAMYGATAGTNLRYIEGIWEISTGLQLMDVASTNALTQNAPRFVPQYDPNFFQGKGQPACLACHGGGMSSLNHGYSTLADTFNFDPEDGFQYIASPTTATMKSLASDPDLRDDNATCNLSRKTLPVCNPDSIGADPNQGWNVSTTWSEMGVLGRMQWTGPTAGQGLNELGQAIGEAGIIYEYMTKRVVNEICPMGMFTADDVTRIARAANPFVTPAGTDDIRTIVAMVASHASCQ
jgi:hypothetical protein